MIFVVDFVFGWMTIANDALTTAVLSLAVRAGETEKDGAGVVAKDTGG